VTKSRPFDLSTLLALTALAVAVPYGAAVAEPAAGVRTFNCAAPSDIARLAYPLVRTAKRLAAGDPLKIIAIGSSSTAGAGASSPAASYPSRLQIELAQMFPRIPVTVINRGVNGEEAREMLARFDAGVISENPDLVIWQVGTNAVLRDQPLTPAGSLIHDGLGRLKASGADVVLIDPQFAPKVLAKVDVDDMVDLIATTAKMENVDLFRRFAVMRHWRQVVNMPYEVFLSADELHMNDWSYGCIAKLLAGAIADAATRSTVTASAAPPR
jgi:acyl-CoA thioesterase I